MTASSSAIGIWFPSSCTAFSGTLSHRTTSLVTELAALRAAFAYIIEQPARQRAIFTDSRAALECLKSHPKDQLVFHIHALHLQALIAHHHVELQWIPARCGITGNVKADSAASIAHDLHGPVIPIPFSRKDASALASKAA